MALDELATVSTAQLVLTWVKPTLKIKGIDSAIRLAQHATTLSPEEDEPVIPTPKSFVKQYLNNALTNSTKPGPVIVTVLPEEVAL